MSVLALVECDACHRWTTSDDIVQTVAGQWICSECAADQPDPDDTEAA